MMCVSQILTMHTLNLHSAVSTLQPNKAGRRKRNLEMAVVNTLILQMETLKHREIKEFVPGYTADYLKRFF